MPLEDTVAHHFVSHFPGAIEFLLAAAAAAVAAAVAAVRTEWAGRQKSRHIIRTLTDFAGTHSVEHLNNVLSRK